MTDRIEDIARRLAFWHGLKMVREGRTVADSAGRGDWVDAPQTYTQRNWQEYTAAAEYVDELIKGLQEDLRRVVMTWDLPGPVSIVKAMDHAIGIARARFTNSSLSYNPPTTAGTAGAPPYSPVACWNAFPSSPVEARTRKDINSVLERAGDPNRRVLPGS